MPYIYSDASFCIAADSSADANGGVCFKTSCWTEDVIEVRSHERMVIVCDTSKRDCLREPKPIHDSQVSQRGWKYRERVLSPKMLHFTSEKLFWECRQEYLAEDGTSTWIDHPLCPPPETLCARVTARSFEGRFGAVAAW